MRNLITILLIGSCLNLSAQTVDNAVKQVMKPTTDSLRDAIAKSVPADVIWEELVVSSRTGNVDTLTDPGIYVLSVEGSASAVRYVHFYGGKIRTANPMAWGGSGSWTVSVINGKVIVSITGTGITYKRRKL